MYGGKDMYGGSYGGGKDMYSMGPSYGKGMGSMGMPPPSYGMGMPPPGGMPMYGKPMGGKY